MVSARFPRLALIALLFAYLARVPCFPALSAGCMFSRAWRGLHVSASWYDWFIALLAFLEVIGRKQTVV